jgi:hypothetical protein
MMPSRQARTEAAMNLLSLSKDEALKWIDHHAYEETPVYSPPIGFAEKLGFKGYSHVALNTYPGYKYTRIEHVSPGEELFNFCFYRILMYPFVLFFEIEWKILGYMMKMLLLPVYLLFKVQGDYND